VLQRVAMCCSVLQCVAVCCSVLHCVALCDSVLQCVAVRCSVLPKYVHNNPKLYINRTKIYINKTTTGSVYSTGRQPVDEFFRQIKLEIMAMSEIGSHPNCMNMFGTTAYFPQGGEGQDALRIELVLGM